MDTGAGKPRRHHRHRTTTVPTTLCASSCTGSGPGPAPAPRRSISLLWSHTGFVKLAEGMGVAARRVHTADELADARRGAFIEPGPAPHGRGGALTAALAITGPSTGPLGDTRVRGRGARPHKVGEHPHPPAVSTPTRVPGRRSQPACGVPGDRIWLGRRRAATGWQFRQLGAQPCAHPVASMRVKPPGRHHRTQPPSHGRGRLQTAAPGNHPAGQHRTRCSPRHRRRHAAGVICCQVVHQPTTVTVSALPSSYDAADGTGAAAGAVRRGGATSAADGSGPGAAVPPLPRAVPSAPTPASLPPSPAVAPCRRCQLVWPGLPLPSP